MATFPIEKINGLIDQIKEYDLEVPDIWNTLTPEQVQADYNGAGPDSWTDKERALLTSCLELFEPCFCIHDVDFTFSDKTRETFSKVNTRLYNNCFKVINQVYPFDLLSPEQMIERTEWILKMEAVYKACVDFGFSAWQD